MNTETKTVKGAAMNAEVMPEVVERGRNTLGIHIDLNCLRMVEIGHGKVRSWAKVPYPAGVRPGLSGFAEFIKAAMAKTSMPRNIPVWVSASLPSLQVRFLSLAKVRPRQASNLVYWTFRKEIPFDAAQVVFDYDVEGESQASGAAKKLDVTACTVAHTDINAITGLCEEAGLNLEGVLIPSFALRNIMRHLDVSPSETVLALHAGEDASSIMFMRGRRVVSHRVFKTGINVIIDVLRDRHPEWSPAEAYERMAAALAEPAAAAEPTEGDESENGRIRSTASAAFSRLIQQVERSISAYLVGRSDEAISTIYVAGALADLPSLVQELGSKLGLNTRPLNPFSDNLAIDKALTPMLPDEAGAMAVAMGTALADPAHTPNLLHTYVKREHEVRLARTRRAVTALGLAAVLALMALHGAINYFNRGLQRELAFAQAEIEKFAPFPDRTMILNMSGKAAARSARLKSMAERCHFLAVLNQVAASTSPDIRLQSIVIEHNDINTSAAGRRKVATASAGSPGQAGIHAHMKGLVTGDAGLQESKLAQYILRVEHTDVFKRAALTSSEQGRDGASQVLRFGVDVEIETLADAQLLMGEVASAREVRP